MSLSLMMRGNWDGLSMASPQLQSYKPERPVYSTPHPVQSTPANNECKLVELRGAEVASFVIGEEEYICLPQAFDLFLKHLVGGLHTVYTKLKRLNITPVVCNVEQVRVLRGLGAIQPGVNRCKLITRKDFETLYQDCTTASRPGRPPKRYPVLPPADLMSHHPGARALNHPRGLLGSPDLSSFHKRLRLDHEGNFHQPQDRRMSTSPTRHSPSMGRKYASGAEELYANAANIYIQQALRQQYQQFLANGIHNGINSQHGGNVNAALAPFIGMSNPGFFNGSIPQNILSHINEYARNNIMPDSSLSEREEQTSPSGSTHQEKLGNPTKPYISPQRRQSLGRQPEHTGGVSESDNEIEERRRERPANISPRQGSERGMNDQSSPVTPHSPSGRKSAGGVSASSSDCGKKYDDENCQKSPLSRDQNQEEFTSTFAKYHGLKGNGSVKLENQRNQSGLDDLREWENAMPGTPNISCMQTLLSNIQGLLKVAADNAKLQDKQLSFEIAELKSRVTKEQELRGMVERKLEESERIRASIQRKLDREREAVKRLQEQKYSGNDKSHMSNEQYKQNDDDIDVTSSPSETGSPHRSLTASPQNHVPRSELTRETNCPSTESNACSDFATHASPTSAPSPKSIGDSSSYWGRSLSVNRTQSPERSIAGSERSWMSCNLVRSSAK